MRVTGIAGYSPRQNPFVESFYSRVREELLDLEEFACLTERAW